LNNIKITYATIVYGVGVNCNKFINKYLNSKSFLFPMKRNVKCNFIPVDDFSKKKYKQKFISVQKYTFYWDTSGN
jgi:hypothetical protein